MDKNKSSFLIMWRRPEEWGKLIYQWVRLSCCGDKYLAKEGCIGAQRIPGIPRSRLSTVVGGGWGSRQRKCRYSRQDSFSDLISMAAQKSPFFACRGTRGYTRPCLENAVLGTMSTIVGWSLWPQKINGERKENTTTTKMGPLPLIPIQGYPQYEFNLLNCSGCGDRPCPPNSKPPPAPNIPKRERGGSINNPNITNTYHPVLSRKTSRRRGHSQTREGLRFRGCECVCTHINIAPAGLVGFSHFFSAEVTALLWD